MEYTKFMADRVKTMKGSAIREMFKRMADPEIISLAGGNPASELFPGDELSKIAGKILMTNPTLALQYGTTDGYPKMKDCARKRAEKVNSVGENDEILIMTGANQGIDLTAKAVLNKGDKVIVESPSFIGSLNAFRTYEAELVGVTVEADIMLKRLLIPAFVGSFSRYSITPSLSVTALFIFLAITFISSIIEIYPLGLGSDFDIFFSGSCKLIIFAPDFESIPSGILNTSP